MAHFAELDATNKVLRIVVVDNSNVSADMAADGETWCANNVADDPAIPNVGGVYPGVAWKQTSYNNNFRKRFAAVDGYFIDDSGEGYFTTVKVDDDWVLNTTDGAYYQPVALPPDNKLTYSADSKTYKYSISWDQANTRFLGYEVTGENAGKYFRNLVNNNDINDLTEEAVSSPTSSQLAAKVWNPSSQAWE